MNDMEQIKKCPFCGSINLIIYKDYCTCIDCEMNFHEETAEFEDLRHKISAEISAVYGDEEHPLICKEPIVIGEDESQGLSELEKPHVISMFHDQEGIIWFNIEGCEEPMNIDNMSLSDLRTIYKEITKKLGKNSYVTKR